MKSPKGLVMEGSSAIKKKKKRRRKKEKEVLLFVIKIRLVLLEIRVGLVFVGVILGLNN